MALYGIRKLPDLGNKVSGDKHFPPCMHLPLLHPEVESVPCTPPPPLWIWIGLNNLHERGDFLGLPKKPAASLWVHPEVSLWRNPSKTHGGTIWRERDTQPAPTLPAMPAQEPHVTGRSLQMEASLAVNGHSRMNVPKWEPPNATCQLSDHQRR